MTTIKFKPNTKVNLIGARYISDNGYYVDVTAHYNSYGTIGDGFDFGMSGAEISDEGAVALLLR